MTKNNIGYLLREGFRGVFLHGFMSFAAICVTVACLIIMGTFSLILYNLHVMILDLEQENEILVYIDENYSEAKAKSVGSQINLISNVHEAKFISRQQALDEKKSELDEIMQETREEEQALKAKAEDLETKIEPRLLSSFKRILKNARNGLGIVYVQRDACGGCFNKIPPQRQLDIKMHKKIIVCEYCGRIMIDPELAGVKTVETETVDDKPKRKRATTRKTASKKSEESETKLS